MNVNVKSAVLWSALVVATILIWTVSSQFRAADNSVTFSEFANMVDAGQVESVTLAGNEITGRTSSGDNFRTYAPPQYDGLVNTLIDRNVAVSAQAAAGNPWATLLYGWAPITPL